MAPRAFTNPAPITDAAREALQSFYCDLCQKGYTRISELENHEKSYDHQHKKRLKDMKAMTRDPGAAEKARKAEERANKEAGIVSLSSAAAIGSAPVKIEMKKPGFKKAGFKRLDDKGGRVGDGTKPIAATSEEEEIYDPFKPTGCRVGCRCRDLLVEVKAKT